MDWPIDTENPIIHLSHFQSIVTLDVTNGFLNQDNPVFMPENIQKFNSLFTLKFKYIRLGDPIAGQVLEQVGALPNLKELTAQGTNPFPTISTFPECKSLRILNLEYIMGCDESFLYKLLLAYPCLESIKMYKIFGEPVSSTPMAFRESTHHNLRSLIWKSESHEIFMNALRNFKLPALDTLVAELWDVEGHEVIQLKEEIDRDFKDKVREFHVEVFPRSDE